MKKRIKKAIYWSGGILLFIIIVVSFSTMKYNEPKCGNGLCEKGEVEDGQSLCDIDCNQMCVASTGATGDSLQDLCSLGWNSTYISLVDSGYIQSDWLKETNEIDFTNPKIQEIAKQLRRDTPKETAKAIARWTYDNIPYNESNDYSDCRYQKSSDILERGYGVCSTMSKLNIALLRANGIPAYSTTGCFKFNTACRLQQTFLGLKLPRFIEIRIDATGHAPTMGYLHNWVIVPLYEDGEVEYVTLESTSGNLYEADCINYREYYSSPPDSLACGLSQLDLNVEDCKSW